MLAAITNSSLSIFPEEEDGLKPKEPKEPKAAVQKELSDMDYLKSKVVAAESPSSEESEDEAVNCPPSGAGQLLGVLIPPPLPAADPEESGGQPRGEVVQGAGAIPVCVRSPSPSWGGRFPPRAATVPSLRAQPGSPPGSRGEAASLPEQPLFRHCEPSPGHPLAAAAKGTSPLLVDRGDGPQRHEGPWSGSQVVCAGSVPRPPGLEAVSVPA